jgi:hypothetical protein
MQRNFWRVTAKLQGRLAGSPGQVAICLENRKKRWIFRNSRWPSLIGHVGILNTAGG